ncbi:MAG: hypothetical protein IT538_07290 [Variibacter sp.]|nr:hypothetical protein [Variibacter sp.]
MTDPGHLASMAGDQDRGRRRRRIPLFGYLPGFLYILILFVAGQFIFADPRATLFNVGPYKLTWVEILLVASAIMAMAEQIKVATPGINNTTEVLFMGAIAIVQVVLFSLAAAKVQGLAMFDNTEFLLLTIINVAQTAVAYQINAATLVRTITS